MKRVITAVVMTAACLLGAICGAGPVSAATRPVVVYEPAVTGPHSVKGVVRPSSWYLTIGPATEFRGTHWSSWGSKTTGRSVSVTGSTTRTRAPLIGRPAERSRWANFSSGT
jgi:hypothetical protein